VDGTPAGEPLDSLGLLPPKPDWAGGLREAWRPGEAARDFVRGLVRRLRQRPQLSAADGVSRLSPHLHWGEIGPRQLLAMARVLELADGPGEKARAWIRQLCWRKPANHALYYMPETPERPVRPELQRFPWGNDEALRRAWQQGRTAATRSSMPACASSGTPAGCTTGRG